MNTTIKFSLLFLFIFVVTLNCQSVNGDSQSDDITAEDGIVRNQDENQLNAGALRMSGKGEPTLWELMTNECTTHRQCSRTAYCYRRKKHRNICVSKYQDGSLCDRDYECLSGYCVGRFMYWKCRGSNLKPTEAKNGRCEETIDCHLDQYCSSKKCINRKDTGWCTKDSQCLSNICWAYRCYKY